MITCCACSTKAHKRCTGAPCECVHIREKIKSVDSNKPTVDIKASMDARYNGIMATLMVSKEEVQWLAHEYIPALITERAELASKEAEIKRLDKLVGQLSIPMEEPLKVTELVYENNNLKSELLFCADTIHRCKEFLKKFTKNYREDWAFDEQHFKEAKNILELPLHDSEKRVKLKEEIFNKWAQHNSYCDFFHPKQSLRGSECNCGFSNALAELAACEGE